jgi:hypothetical protein
MVILSVAVLLLTNRQLTRKHTVVGVKSPFHSKCQKKANGRRKVATSGLLTTVKCPYVRLSVRLLFHAPVGKLILLLFLQLLKPQRDL